MWVAGILGCVGETPEQPGPDPYADEVVSFSPVEPAVFGQESMPDIVLGPPQGAGDASGSLDVVSLGEGGEIVVAFLDLVAVDGPGEDFVVYENPFAGWVETGIVSVSEDGDTWYEFPCEAENVEDGHPGCAGVAPVFPSSEEDLDAAGGDAFDLGELGVSEARYVRIVDSGHNEYGHAAGGFDLDAVAAKNVEETESRPAR